MTYEKIVHRKTLIRIYASPDNQNWTLKQEISTRFPKIWIRNYKRATTRMVFK